VAPSSERLRRADGLHESTALVNASGPSCRQVVNQQLSHPSGAVPWEASPFTARRRSHTLAAVLIVGREGFLPLYGAH
jgi:hypothetical protein